MPKHRHFNPYWPEAEARAEASAKAQREENAFWKRVALCHGNPDWDRRRIVHTNQILRAKRRPVTLPKVWG